MVLYGIWFARNKKFFEDRSMPPAVVTKWSRKQVEKWTEANSKSSAAASRTPMPQQQIITWKPPGEGSFKINVDATVKEGQDSFAIGMVLRNSQGQFLAGRVMKFAGTVQVMKAEMIGIAEALSWLKELPVTGCYH